MSNLEFLDEGPSFDEMFPGTSALDDMEPDEFSRIVTNRSTSPYVAKPASAFEGYRANFVWNPYIPRGDYSVLMAGGGTGKTILCCGLAAAISTGSPLPGETEWKDPQNVLIISAEDTGELLKERLSHCGADLDRVFILDCKASEGLSFGDDVQDFTDVVRARNPALVIVDPWHAFVASSVDLNRVNCVRPVFQRLANVAKKCNCGLILVSHVNKKPQAENANNAATGSSDFINAARSALMVIFDDEPGKENSRILVHTKSNYSAAGRSVEYAITPGGGMVWNGFSDVTRQTLENAARWRKTTSEALQMAAQQERTNHLLIEAIREHGIPGKTVNVSYDQLREDNGEDVFDGTQPKRALDAIKGNLKLCGITIQTGKTVRFEGRTRNGFSITTLERLEDVEEGLPE